LVPTDVASSDSWLRVGGHDFSGFVDMISRNTPAGAEQKLAQLDRRTRRATTVTLGLPTFRDIAGRSVTATKDPQ